jgi:hypothetical protein
MDEALGGTYDKLFGQPYEAVTETIDEFLSWRLASEPQSNHEGVGNASTTPERKLAVLHDLCSSYLGIGLIEPQL